MGKTVGLLDRRMSPRSILMIARHGQPSKGNSSGSGRGRLVQQRTAGGSGTRAGGPIAALGRESQERCMMGWGQEHWPDWDVYVDGACQYMYCGTTFRQTNCTVLAIFASAAWSGRDRADRSGSISRLGPVAHPPGDAPGSAHFSTEDLQITV